MKYAATCLHYIHLNPVNSGIVKNVEDWHYSSYRDYAGLRNRTLCNKSLTTERLKLDFSNLANNKLMNDDSLKNIW